VKNGIFSRTDQMTGIKFEGPDFWNDSINLAELYSFTPLESLA